MTLAQFLLQRVRGDGGLASALFGDEAIHHVLDLFATFVQLGDVDLQVAVLVRLVLQNGDAFHGRSLVAQRNVQRTW